MSSDTTKRKIGRPHAFTETKQEQLLHWISEGLTMASACKKVGVAYTTVHQQDEDDAEFSARLARARRRGAWARADFANDTTREMYERAKAGEASHEEISAGRELLHQARWEASKLIPKIFGDKQQVDLKAEVSVENRAVDKIELARRVLWILNQAQNPDRSDPAKSDAALPAPEAERVVNAAPQPVDPQDERDDPDVLLI